MGPRTPRTFRPWAATRSYRGVKVLAPGRAIRMLEQWPAASRDAAYEHARKTDLLITSKIRAVRERPQKYKNRHKQRVFGCAALPRTRPDWPVLVSKGCQLVSTVFGPATGGIEVCKGVLRVVAPWGKIPIPKPVNFLAPRCWLVRDVAPSVASASRQKPLAVH